MLLPFNCTSSLIPEMDSSIYKEVNFFFNAWSVPCSLCFPLWLSNLLWSRKHSALEAAQWSIFPFPHHNLVVTLEVTKCHLGITSPVEQHSDGFLWDKRETQQYGVLFSQGLEIKSLIFAYL